MIGLILKNLMSGDSFTARGHPLITALHATTLELTREPEMTHKGDCIVGVSSSKACYDISEELKESIRNGERICMAMSVGGLEERVTGYGRRDLSLEDRDEMVIRKSQFACPRTLFINADKAASDLDRQLVELLKNPETEIRISLFKV